MKIKSVRKSELNQMLKKAIEKVEGLGIKIEHNISPNVRTYKATSYYGHIRYKEEFDECEITISEYHLDNGYKAVMGTMIHEVLHACKGAINHGKQWQAYARTVNKAYQHNISRLGSYDNGYRLPKKKHEAKYMIECMDCENVITRVRKSKLVNNTDNYICGKCNGKLKRTK